MLENIHHLAELGQALEPDSRERGRLVEAVTRYAESYLETIPYASTFSAAKDWQCFLDEAEVREEGADIGRILALLDANVNSAGINTLSKRYLAYIPSGGLFHAALGDYLAAVANRYVGLYFASPGGVHIENTLLRWMAHEVGYPDGASGNLTSGGSLAHLIAVVTARDACGVAGAAIPRSVVYMTGHAHHSLDKALHIAGLGQCVKRLIPVDAAYRMKPEALDAAIVADRKAGLHPWLVVANAGTTNSGAVDPLDALADIAAARDLWCHVDGAYGGLFVLCPEGRAALSGIHRSDSLIMDPHKTLFLPYGTAAVLVKDRQKHFAAFNAEADYMRNILDETGELSPADLAPELTKHFRGLRLWLPLKLLGAKPFRAALSEKIHLARYFYEQIRRVEGFEVGAYPDLSIVTYRYLPKRGDADEFNHNLVRAIQDEGQIFISSTRIDRRVVLRAAVLSFRTHMDDVDMAIDVLKRHAKRLEAT